MAKKKSSGAPKPSAPKPPAAAELAPVAPVIEAKPEPVKRYEAPVADGIVKVCNISRATCNGIAPGTVGELPAEHPGLHPLALEFELVEG